MIGRSPSRWQCTASLYTVRGDQFGFSAALIRFLQAHAPAAPSLHSGIAVGGVSGLYYFALYCLLAVVSGSLLDLPTKPGRHGGNSERERKEQDKV